MNFIHDIMLNLNEDLFECFEWNTSDTILHIKKIPIFKVSKNDYFNIKNNKVRFDKEFINKIYKKTLFYKNTQVNFLFLICFDEEVIGIKLNNKGIIKAKSHLLVDEEESILRIAHKINLSKINYEIINKEKKIHFYTRKELNNIKQITNKINYLFQKKEYKKLKYLFLECFEMNEDNIDLIYQKLVNEIYHKNVLKKANDFFALLKK